MAILWNTLDSFEAAIGLSPSRLAVLAAPGSLAWWLA